MISLDDFFKGYGEAALWSTTDMDDEDTHLDRYGYQLSPACKKAMHGDCAKFIAENITALHHFRAVTQCDDWRLGFLFWLNRDGHGVGFWETNHSVGDKLSDASKPWGSFGLYADHTVELIKSHHWG